MNCISWCISVADGDSKLQTQALVLVTECVMVAKAQAVTILARLMPPLTRLLTTTTHTSDNLLLLAAVTATHKACQTFHTRVLSSEITVLKFIRTVLFIFMFSCTITLISLLSLPTAGWHHTTASVSILGWGGVWTMWSVEQHWGVRPHGCPYPRCPWGYCYQCWASYPNPSFAKGRSVFKCLLVILCILYMFVWLACSFLFSSDMFTSTLYHLCKLYS